MSGLIEDYLEGAPAARAFYASPPESLFTTPPPARAWPPELVQALTAYQQLLNAPKDVGAGNAAVITGQQPGVFTGPLYTVYKAVSAIKLARAVADRVDAPCTPIFWLGSEDHDFEEARTTYFFGKSGEPIEFRYEPQADVEKLPMHRVPVESQLHDAVDNAAAQTRGSEFTGEIREFLHDSLAEAQSLAGWTARILARLFRDTELVFFTPELVEARRLSADVIATEIRNPLESTALLQRASASLHEKGYDVQLHRRNADCNIFMQFDGKRQKLSYERNRFVAPDVDASFDQSELLTLLEREPDRFSPNVALRCVVQQRLFPAAAYVAGPGELAYWAQLKGLFDLFHADMPVVYPRSQAVITTPGIRKLQKSLGAGVHDLDASQDALLTRILSGRSNDPAYEYVEQERARLAEVLNRFAEGLQQHDANAGQIAARLTATVEESLDRIEHTLLRRNEEQVSTVRAQVSRLSNALVPFGKPQERVYNIFSFLFEYGWELIPGIMEDLDVFDASLQEIQL